MNLTFQTAVDCNCKTCPGDSEHFVCTCFCHERSMRASKASGFFNAIGAMNAEMNKAEMLTDEELATQLAENIGNEERIDSFKCALVGEMLHRFKTYSEASREHKP